MNYWNNKYPYPAIPTAFTEAKTYLELMYALLDEVKQLEEYVKGLEDNSKIYTDTQIALVNARITQEVLVLNERITQLNTDLINYINSNISALDSKLTSYINSEVSKLNNQIIQLNFTLSQRIDNVVIQLTAYTDTKIAELKSYIDSQLIDIKVIDPVTGRITSIQAALNSLASLHRFNAISAKEYDDLLLTAKAYDDKLITAFSFDFDSKQILIP